MRIISLWRFWYNLSKEQSILVIRRARYHFKEATRQTRVARDGRDRKESNSDLLASICVLSLCIDYPASYQ